MKKIAKRNIYARIIKLILSLKLNQFAHLIGEMIFQDSERLSRKLIEVVGPVNSSELILKVFRSFNRVILEELIHLCHMLDEDPVKKISDILPFISPKMFLPAVVKKVANQYDYNHAMFQIKNTKRLLERQLEILQELEYCIEY